MTRLLKEALRGLLSDSELAILYGAFDVIGDIAVIRIPEGLLSKKTLIAEAILKNVKNVKTVLRQIGPVSGELRTKELERLLGEDRTHTLYREHGCIFKVDLAKVYFSPRLSSERLRIARLVSSGETVVNLFAGVGTYSILIARLQRNVKVYSIDINEDAYRLALENIALNRVQDSVIPILGDARIVVEHSLQNIADRVLMPLPEKASEYIDVAIKCLKKNGGTIHNYLHIHSDREEDPVEKACRQFKDIFPLKHRIVSARRVREVGPRWSQIVLDVEVEKP